MMLIGGSVMFLILVVLIIFILTSCIRIVPQLRHWSYEASLAGWILGRYGEVIRILWCHLLTEWQRK